VRIDGTHRRWALGSAAAFVAAALVYAVGAAGTVGPWSGGSALGLTFGVAGFALMVFAGLLAARRKVPIWRIGRAQSWMRGHLWLGLLSLPLIFFHAGFAFGGPLTRALMWLLIIVVASGLVGAALQHVLPRVMLDRLPMETIYEQIPHVRAQLVSEADGVVAAACGAISGDLATIVRIDADPAAPLRDFYLNEMRPFLESPDAPHRLADPAYGAQATGRLRTVLPETFHQAIADLENLCAEERQLSREQRLHRVLHGWLLVHVPLSFALLALAVIHIVMALRY